MSKKGDYQYKFKFDQNQLEYDFRIKKRRNWWWLLLLLLPLLLFIRCSKEVAVKVVTTDNEPVAEARVESRYVEYQLFKSGEFLYKKEHILTGATDSTGITDMAKIETSVWSWIFHTKTTFASEAQKECLGGNGVGLLHWHFSHIYVVEVVDTCIDTTKIPVHVVDMETGDDIPGAMVHWRANIDGRDSTNVNGIFYIPRAEVDSVIAMIDAKAKGYADTVYNNLALPTVTDSMITIVMRPIDVAFNCDIVMCIDNTGSMEYLLENVKNNTLNFYSDLKDYCDRTGKEMGEVRMQIIDFGDLDEDPLHISEFFSLPEQSGELSRYVSKIELSDGSDECGLEALAAAVTTSWKVGKMRRRQVVIVYTDEPSVPLGEKRGSSYYPSGLPSSFGALKVLWDAMDGHKKRLILFAPDTVPWTDISTSWDAVYHEKDDLSSVLTGRGYNKIIKSICESL